MRRLREEGAFTGPHVYNLDRLIEGPRPEEGSHRGEEEVDPIHIVCEGHQMAIVSREKGGNLSVTLVGTEGGYDAAVLGPHRRYSSGGRV